MELLIKHGADTNAVSYALKLTRKFLLVHTTMHSYLLSLRCYDGCQLHRFTVPSLPYLLQHTAPNSSDSVLRCARVGNNFLSDLVLTLVWISQFEILRISKPGRTSITNTKKYVTNLSHEEPLCNATHLPCLLAES
jgi:hypothetical protein